MTNITISGSGLVGSLMAAFLGKRGYKVNVYERRSDPRVNITDRGRSINLALSDRGWRALDKVGMKEKISQIAMPMYQRAIHDTEGNITIQPYGKDGQAIYSVSRSDLNIELIKYADSFENVNINFEHKLESVDLKNKKLKFQNSEIGYDLLLGTDGAFSTVRYAMQFAGRFNYSQTFLEHGYKELTIYPDTHSKWKIDNKSLHIWPRKDFMMIALPNLDGSFTCTLFLAYQGEVSFENLKSEEQIKAFFQKYFSDLVPLMPDFVEQFFTNPTSNLVTIKCSPWNYGKEVLLLGDSAHAIVPFYGQGMNAGFEDCHLLDNMIDDLNQDWDKIIPFFAQKRKPDGDAIADLALRNFIEMRDLTANENFLFRKKVEMFLLENHPDLWMPLYSMVTFSNLSYSQALREGINQDKIMEKVMYKAQKLNLSNVEEIANLVIEEIS